MVLCGQTRQATAQTFNTWQGTTSSWSTGGNWNSGSYSNYGQYQFTGGGSLVSNNDAGTVSQWRVFFAGGNSYTLSSNGGALNLFDFSSAHSWILSDSTVAQTFSTLDVNFAATTGNNWGQISARNNGDLSLNNVGITGSAVSDLRITGQSTGKVTISGVISGSGKNVVTGLRENGSTVDSSSNVIFSGNNTYSGTTTVRGGILNIRHGNALGATSSGTSVSAGASLQLQGAISVGAEALSLTGNTGTPYSGTDLTGALRNISDTNTYGGAITLSSQAAIGADAGTLNLTNTINNGSFRLIIVGAGNVTSSNVISGSGDLLKQDAGTLTVTGNNSFGGNSAVFIDKGTIQVGTGGTLGTTNGTSTGWINMGASVSGRNGDTFLLALDAGVTIANPIDSRYYSPDVSGNQTIGGSNTTGTTTFSGTLALHDNVTLTAANSGTVLFSGQIQNGSISGANNQTAGQALIGGVGGSVTKTGAGTVVFAGANNYTGTTTISAGTLELGSTGSLTATSSVVVSTGGTLLLGNSDQINNSAGLTLGGGTFTPAGHSETLGTLTLSANSTIELTLGDNSQDIRFSDYARTGGLLSINNWTTIAGTSGTAGRLLFSTSATFDSTELANVQFTGFGTGAQLISFGGGFNELVPVPEPSSIVAALGLIGIAGLHRRRKRRILAQSALV
jgi:fibronectin-binding autotransporter adhesin